MPETAAVPCAGYFERLAHLQGTGRCPARAFKETNGAPNPRYHVQSGRTEDHLRGASRPQGVEVWHVPRGHELLTSDSPAIAFRYSSDHTTIEANVAVGDASGIALPLARDCLATIGPKSKDEELLPCTVELFNRLQVEGAHRYVYYHPGGRLKAFAQACLGTQPAVD